MYNLDFITTYHFDITVLDEIEITGTMINNYIEKKNIDTNKVDIYSQKFKDEVAQYYIEEIITDGFVSAEYYNDLEYEEVKD